MKKTTESVSAEKITYTVQELMQVLSCGRTTAVRIGEEAHAGIKIGKRKLYSAKKINEYIDSMTA